MHGVDPSCGAPFGHKMFTGTCVPSFDVASSRRTSRLDRSTGGCGDSSASAPCSPDFGSKRCHVAGVVNDSYSTRGSPYHSAGCDADDTGGPCGALSDLPAVVNTRSSVGP